MQERVKDLIIEFSTVYDVSDCLGHVFNEISNEKELIKSMCGFKWLIC
jgi:hypothetical protein